MTHLVMVSGGVDSVYAAAKVLNETKLPVHLHHIVLVNKEGRHEAEMKAWNDLLPKLERFRLFTSSISEVNHMQYTTAIPFDMAVVCFEAGAVARNMHFEGRKIKTWTIGTHAAEGHWQNRWKVLEPIVHAVCWPEVNTPEFVLDMSATKAEEIKYLEKYDLFQGCWYCRFPRGDKRCGHCKTCIEVSESI